MSEITEKLKVAIADRYVIERELGAGGMATVYLAHDVKHDRKVALKVLRPELAAVIGAERFLQEIKVTANLQHSHILPLYDSGTAEGFLYYVMPYVEGETLRTRIDREKQLGVEEAVALTRAIASALEHAHRQGVIHRDIKPENVLLRDDDPLIADFGIALAVSHAGGSRLTETGLSIGTPHYMSPEQAMGDRAVDARSDVYSLGAMLYEMLVGDPPYTGSTAQAIVAKVITEKAAPVASLRDTVPPHVSAAIGKALAKLPADRFPSAAGFADALARPGPAPATGFQTAVDRPGGATPRRGLVAWTGWAVAAVLAVLAGWLTLRPTPAPPPASRFAILLPSSQALAAVRGTRVALSPDGSRMAYVGIGAEGRHIFVRRRDQLTASPLPETETAVHLFFSPDGRRIGFTEEGQRLYAVSLSGGPPILVADSLVGLDGATWSADGFIYFDGFTGGGTDGLRRVPVAGGVAEVVTTVDTAAGEFDHVWPTALPDGRGILYTVARDGGLNSSDVAVLTPSGEQRILVRGVAATYTAGSLLYATVDGSLLAAPFDLESLAITGEPVAIGGAVGVRPFGATDLAASGEGMVAYVTGGQAGAPDEVVWMSTEGQAEAIDPDWHGSFQTLAMAPDGRRLAISIQANGEEHLWMQQLPRGPITKLSFDGTLNYRPAWMPGGRSVSYISNRGGTNALLSVRAEGGAPAETVLAFPDRPMQEGVWARDGSLAFRSSPRDLHALLASGDTVPLVVTPFEERAPALSPDGRWLAYQSDESGHYEVYVRPFPDAAAGRWQVSTDGGVVPRWSPDGRALYYIGNQDLMAVDVLPGTTFTLGRRRPLFPRGFMNSAVESSYDVAPDGRFVMIRSRTGSEASQLIVIENVAGVLHTPVP